LPGDVGGILLLLLRLLLLLVVLVVLLLMMFVEMWGAERIVLESIQNKYEVLIDAKCKSWVGFHWFGMFWLVLDIVLIILSLIY
jgi:hypothetical protein